MPKKVLDKKEIERRASRTILGRTIFLMVLCGVVVFIPLIMQLYKIQIVEHDFYEQRAISQQTSPLKISANRGTIYDRNYSILAQSASVESAILAPNKIKSDEEAKLIARGLSEILGLEYEWVFARTENRALQYQIIKRKIDDETAERIRQFKADNKLEAVQLEPDTKRFYPLSSVASQIIGFVGTDNYGLEGLEMQYDETLTGIPGKIITAKNAVGTSMPFKFEKYIDAQNGQNMVLTLDETLQRTLEKHLNQAVIDADVQNRASGIIMEVDTGEILAMATTDGIDLNNFNALTDADRAKLEGLEGEEYNKLYNELLLTHWRNKTVTDTYDPGSIFKVITCSMALEEGTVSLNSTFNCTGSAMVEGWNSPISCWKKQGHGTQTLERALQNSCNPAFMQIGFSVGTDKFYDYFHAFGFAQYSGVDLPGEATGMFFERGYFTSQRVSLAVASFGQTFTVTPLQMITAVSAVVNGGYLMRPHVVKEIVNDKGVVTSSVEPEIIRQVISEETSATMCYLMEQVVADGSGRNAQVAGYRIGGKTATSEKTGEKDKDGKYVVSFISVFPAEDPKYAMLVLLDTPGEKIPKIQRSGGYLAAPLAGRIMKDILPYLGYEPSYTGTEMFGAEVSVPKIANMSVDAAKVELDKRGLGVRIEGSGDTVVGQIPAAGAKIMSSATVILYTESEAPDGEVTVPNVIGKSPESANTAITNAGLFLKPAGALSAQTSSVAANSQSVEPGTTVPRGTIIEVNFLDSSVGDSTAGN